MADETARDRLIEWTGERCVPWADDVQVIYEHYHRYIFALRFVGGKRVLDLASGEGYGAALMGTTASSVVGVDSDADTVAHAGDQYRLDNLSFRVGSITDPDSLAELPEFDVITCFEAIEHVVEQDMLMRLVADHLAPDGVFLCSTPDVDRYTNDHGNENPYHLHELHEGEFRALLGSAFERVVVLRQNVAVGSLIHGYSEDVRTDTHTGVALNTLQRQSGDHWAARDGAPHTYLIGIASHDTLTFPETSVLTDPDLSLVGQAKQQAGAEEYTILQQRISDLQKELERSEAARADVSATVAAAQTHERELTDELGSAREKLDHLYADQRRLARDIARLRDKSANDATRLSWVTRTNERLHADNVRLASENAALRTEQSASAQALIDRYRTIVEKVAPRGKRRRQIYENILGRRADPVDVTPQTPGPVAVTTSDEPIVSVIIPTYGKWEYTRRCLESIERELPLNPIEVLVVDDCSVDDSPECVAQCSGVTLLRTPRNVGFVGACNFGADSARGDFVMFLNNDTEVQPGWLDSLVELMEDRPEAGLVGSQLVYPDGSLQECGAIVWSDGSGWNYGRGDSPTEPRYRPVREVDYCSGAALMVRRELFRDVGGFDSRYAPAYYEDTDLAFAMRALGYRTLVNPNSVVVHHEGVSNGTDVTLGVKSHQEVNRSTFVDKWSDQLRTQLAGPDGANVWLARHRGNHGHRGGLVLVVDHQVPRPDEDSGSVRMASLIRLLTELGERVVFFPMNHAAPEPYTRNLHKLGVTVLADPGRQDEFLREAGETLRLALLSRPNVAWRWLEEIRGAAPQCLVVYDTVDLHFVRLTRRADLVSGASDTNSESALRRRADVLREMELGLVRTVDVTLTVSESEKELLSDLVPGADVEVVSNIHDVAVASDGPERRCDLLFVGSFDHIPNRDAARWLATEIMPLVWQDRPDAVAHIVGSNPPEEVRKLAADGIVVHGWVADLESHYARARVVVAPLRFGAGVKGKVGESLGKGVPVVGTSVAAEGMRLDEDGELLVSDSADGLAERVVMLLSDDEAWLRLSEAGREAVRYRFGQDAARVKLADLLSRSEHSEDVMA